MKREPINSIRKTVIVRENTLSIHEQARKMKFCPNKDEESLDTVSIPARLALDSVKIHADSKSEY